MKACLIAASILTIFQFAQAETVEKKIFTCQSAVPGFETFSIAELTTAEGAQVQVKYKLKAGLIEEEVWDQFGEVPASTGIPIFQSEFSRKVVTPVTPPEPIPSPILPPPSQPDEQEFYLNVAINQVGTGSLSVDADLAPIDCQKAP